MNSTQWVKLHLDSNEPIATLDNLLGCRAFVRCVNSIPDDDITLIQSCLLNDQHEPLLIDYDIKSLLSVAEINRMSLTMRLKMIDINPNINSVSLEYFRELQKRAKEGIQSFPMVMRKASMTSSIYEFYGIPIVRLSDARVLIWEAAKEYVNETNSRNR